jgi:hypothetical protein
MKNPCTLLLCLCITLNSFIASAQESHRLVNQPDYNKPKLFTSLPEKIKVDVSELALLIDKQTGNAASLNAAETQSVRFEGNILFSVTDAASGLKSIMINLSLFPGARLTLTQLTHNDGSKEYAGRILSFQHGDAYVLEKEEGVYFLSKKSFYDLVNE